MVQKCFYTIFFYVIRLHATDPEFTTIKRVELSLQLYGGGYWKIENEVIPRVTQPQN